MKKTLIEKRETEGAYGMISESMIVDTDKHGRLLVSDGFGGMDNQAGGMYRWKHGTVTQLQPDDSFETLSADWNDFVTIEQAARQGYDPNRPVLEWPGHMIAGFVKTVTD